MKKTHARDTINGNTCPLTRQDARDVLTITDVTHRRIKSDGAARTPAGTPLDAYDVEFELDDGYGRMSIGYLYVEIDDEFHVVHLGIDAPTSAEVTYLTRAVHENIAYVIASCHWKRLGGKTHPLPRVREDGADPIEARKHAAMTAEAFWRMVSQLGAVHGAIGALAEEAGVSPSRVTSYVKRARKMRMLPPGDGEIAA